mgnify:CR=1 FL=1
MAVAFQSVVTASGQLVSSLSWSHTAAGSDRLGIIDACLKPDTVTVSSAAWGTGNAATIVSSIVFSDDTEMWRRIAPPASAQTVSVTLSAQADEIIAASRNYTGAHQTTPLGTAATNSGTSTAPTVTVTSASGELVIETNGFDNDTTGTAGAGQTERYDQAPFGLSHRGSDEAGAAPNVVMSYSLLGAANDWQIVGVSIKPVAAGGTETVGTISAFASVLATLLARALSTGTIPGISSVSGTANARKQIVGTIAGTSTVSATTLARALTAGGIAAVSTVSGTTFARALSVGSIEAVSTVSATALARVPSIGSIEGSSTVSGVVQAGAQTTETVGEIAGTSTVSAAALAQVPMTGTIAAESSVSGVLQSGVQQQQTVGTITGTSDVSGVLASLQILETVGTISGESTISGTLTSEQAELVPSVVSDAFDADFDRKRRRRWQLEQEERAMLRSLISAAFEPETEVLAAPVAKHVREVARPFVRIIQDQQVIAFQQLERDLAALNTLLLIGYAQAMVLAEWDDEEDLIMLMEAA